MVTEKIGEMKSEIEQYVLCTNTDIPIQNREQNLHFYFYILSMENAKS